MVGWLAPGLLSLALLAPPAGGFTTRAMYAMIDEQLRQYPQPESAGDALRYLVDMIERLVESSRGLAREFDEEEKLQA